MNNTCTNDINISNIKNILVIGYGVTGKSVYNFLKKLKGHNVVVYDDSKQQNIPNCVTDIDWNNIDLVIKSPAIHIMPHNRHKIIAEALEHNKLIISALDLFILSNPKAKIIGITGTNGKSTTVTLLYNIMKNANLSVALGGNIGLPYFDVPKSDYYVFEISSYELASSKYLKFYIGAILNIEPDHLDFHGSFEEYIKAKHKIIDTAEIKFISYENKTSLDKYQDTKYRDTAITISTYNEPKADYYIDEGVLINHKHNMLLDLSVLANSYGWHNDQNTAFAYAISVALGIKTKCISQTISNFQPLPHRINRVKKCGNVLFINDSKATNPSATSKALESFVGYNIYWLVGGRTKNVDPMPYVKQYLSSVIKIYLFGESVNEFKNYFKDIIETVECKTMEEAVKCAYQDAINAVGATVILLSPMCSSFDQFKSFEDRGNTFVQIVNKLVCDRPVCDRLVCDRLATTDQSKNQSEQTNLN